MANKYTVHGVNFIRTGNCNQCGGCEEKCLKCPHGSRVDGRVVCDVYEQRIKNKHWICEACTNNKDSIWYKRGKPVTHEICTNFPDQPFLRVIESGECNYKFVPVTKNDKSKFEELKKAWQ